MIGDEGGEKGFFCPMIGLTRRTFECHGNIFEAQFQEVLSFSNLVRVWGQIPFFGIVFGTFLPFFCLVNFFLLGARNVRFFFNGCVKTHHYLGICTPMSFTHIIISQSNVVNNQLKKFSRCIRKKTMSEREKVCFSLVMIWATKGSN